MNIKLTVITLAVFACIALASEAKTTEVMSGDWFHTGDIGKFDDGFLKITDRKKEMFKTSGGKYIAPAALESELKQSRFIEQVMVIGEGEKMPAALIQPNFSFIEEWAERHEYKITDVTTDEQIISRIDLVESYLPGNYNTQCNFVYSWI